MQMFGSTSLHCLTISHSQLLLKETYSVFMVVSPHQLTHLIKSTNSTELWKCPPRVQFVIFCGLILMTDVVGESLQEVQGTHLVRILVSNSTIPMISNS